MNAKTSANPASAPARRLGPSEVPPNPRWSFPTIHHRPDANRILLESVLDREWKALGKGAVEGPVRDEMNAPEYLKALDIGVQADDTGQVPLPCPHNNGSQRSGRPWQGRESPGVAGIRPRLC